MSDAFAGSDASQQFQEGTKTLQRRADPSAAAAPRRTGSVQDIVDAVRSDPLYAPVQELFAWREPIRSGLVLGISLLALVLLTVGGYSVVSLIAYIFLFTFLLSFALVQYSNFSGTPHIFKNRIGQVSDFVSKDQFIHHADTTYRIVDAVSLLARDALLFSDVAFSFKFVGAVFGTSLLFSWFSPVTLAIVPFIFGFVWTRLYQQQQAQIDALYNKGVDLFNQKVTPLLAKVPLDKLKLKKE